MGLNSDKTSEVFCINFHLEPPMGSVLFVLLFHVIICANKSEIMWSLFIHYVCVHDYWKINEPVSLRLGVMMGRLIWKNWLIFGNSPVLDMDSGSLHFSIFLTIVEWRF